MLTFKTIISIVAALMTLLSGILAYSNWKSSGKLSELRGEVNTHIAEAKAADTKAAQATVVAQASQVAAAEAQKAAQAHAARAQELQGQLSAIKAAIPTSGTSLDTLAANIAAAREARDVAVQASDSWHQAYDSQVQATIHLQASVDTLEPALAAARASLANLAASSQKLSDASGGSFWKRLVPTLHVGATAGVNPQGKPDAVIGIGAGWNL